MIKTHSSIRTASGEHVNCFLKGTAKIPVFNQNGKRVELVLKDAIYVPNFQDTLVCVAHLIADNYDIEFIKHYCKI